MWREILLVLMLSLVAPFVHAQDAANQVGPELAPPPEPPKPTDGPPISIVSPDTGTTYVYGILKHRALAWNRHDQMLIARVTFTEDSLDVNSPQDDTLEFRLPGVAFDPVKGVFSAKTAKGEVIPVAHITKQLFFKSIEVLPNARVRIIRDHGKVTLVLEAISPNDPAMKQAPASPATAPADKQRDYFN